jgi:hypothetical protein
MGEEAYNLRSLNITFVLACGQNAYNRVETLSARKQRASIAADVPMLKNIGNLVSQKP